MFARFDDDGRRLTLDDVFYNNNQNAFVVSEETRDASRAAGKLLLDCIWAEPESGNAVPKLRRESVSFDQLTLDPDKQQAFFFDYAGAKSQQIAEKNAEHANWPARFECWWLEVANRHASLYDQEDEVRSFPQCVPEDWNDGGMMTLTPLRFYGKEMRLPVAMLDCFYSAKHARPIGLNRKHFIEVAHYLAESYPRYLLWFRKALKVYGCGTLLQAQDKSGNWAKRVHAYKADMRADPEKYAPDQKHQRLFEMIFPELAPLPDVAI